MGKTEKNKNYSPEFKIRVIMDMREHRLIYPSKTIDELSSSKGKYGAQSASVEYDTASPRCVRITDVWSE